MRNLDEQANTPAKNKLTRYLLRRDTTLTEQTVVPLLRDIERFVKLAQKIYTQPQAQVKFKDKMVNGKKVGYRIVETDIQELGKLSRNKSQPLLTALRQLNQSTFNETVITEEKHD